MSFSCKLRSEPGAGCAALALALGLTACSSPEAPLDVLLITLDTTRADHLGCYGHDGIATPNIDALAATGTLYERCYTPVPITLPSHLSILSGTYPAFHGVRENAGFYVAEEVTTLAEILADEGYATAAFVGAYPLDSQTGIDQGFAVYDDAYPSSLEEGKHPALRGFFDERPAAEVVRPAMAWLDTVADDRPLFLWTHFFDPHQPWIPPSPYRETYAHAPYDGEIASVDEAIGQLLRHLEERGRLDRTLIVLTADHGESLGEHGEETHALLLYSTTLRVPLILRDPERLEPRRVAAPVATVDILPTLLDRLGLPLPAALQGEKLPPSDDVASHGREIFAETLYGALLHGWSPIERLTVDDAMVIHGPRPRLYDLAADPAERTDLAPTEPEQVLRLRRRLLRRKQELGRDGIAASAGVVSPEKRARLAALGYAGGGGPVSGELEVSADLPDPHDAIAVFREMNEGRALREAGRPELAAAVLEHARSVDPTNPYLASHLAMTYLQLGDLPAAERALADLLRLSPDHVVGQLLLAETRWQRADGGASVSALERALELDPMNRATRLLLAHRLEDVGEDARAGTAYEALVAEAGDDTWAVNGYATWLHRHRRADEAEEHLRQLLREQPFFAPAHLNLGVVLYDRGRHREAERHAVRAIELRPTYGLAHELRALLREAAGDIDASRQAWQLAGRFAATSEARERARQALTASR